MEENKDKGLYFKGLIEKSREVIEYLNTNNPAMNVKLWEIYAGLCSYQKMYASYFESTQDLKTKLSRLEEELDFYRKQEIFDSEKRKKVFDDGVATGKKLALEAMTDYIKHYIPIKCGTSVIITNYPEYIGCYGEVVMHNIVDDSVVVSLTQTNKQIYCKKDQYSVLTTVI